MKIMMISKIKDIFFTLPFEVQLRFKNGSDEFVNKFRSNGKILEIYNIPGRNMAVAIYEVESAEELTSIVIEYPMASFMEFDVYMLSDFDEYTQQLTVKLTGLINK